MFNFQIESEFLWGIRKAEISEDLNRIVPNKQKTPVRETAILLPEVSVPGTAGVVWYMARRRFSGKKSASVCRKLVILNEPILPMLLYRNIATLLCFLCWYPLFAQSVKEADCTLYTRVDGLSSNYVSGIVQDSTGFIWIATKKGLNRFDGRSFTT